MEDRASAFELIISIPDDGGLTEEPHRNRRILIEAYEAQRAGHSGALQALMDPEVAFHQAETLPYGCEKQGIADTRDAIATMFEAWNPLRLEILEVAATGDIVISHFRFTGTSKNTGRVYDALGVEILRFRDGKIIDWRPFYWDTQQVRQVCGQQV